VTLGIVLIFVGLAVIISTAVLFGSGSLSFGAVIFIGPFPIAVGAGPSATWLILIGVIIAVISVLLFVIMSRRASTVVG